MLKKVLLVEDNETGGLLIQSLFEDRKDVVFNSVAYIAEARIIIEKEKFDLFLLDIMLPEGNGLDFLVELKQTERTANIPAVIVSAYENKEYIEFAMNHGAVDYIMKPVGINNLYERVLKILYPNK